MVINSQSAEVVLPNGEIIEFGGKVFGTTMLDIKSLLVTMAIGLVIIPVDMVKKLIVGKK